MPAAFLPLYSSRRTRVSKKKRRRKRKERKGRKWKKRKKRKKKTKERKANHQEFRLSNSEHWPQLQYQAPTC